MTSASGEHRKRATPRTVAVDDAGFWNESPPLVWRLVEVSYAQRTLGLSRSSVYRLMADGRLRSVKVGSARRLLLVDVLSLVESAG